LRQYHGSACRYASQQQSWQETAGNGPIIEKDTQQFESKDGLILFTHFLLSGVFPRPAAVAAGRRETKGKTGF
jgi:hypothetical protein